MDEDGDSSLDVFLHYPRLAFSLAMLTPAALRGAPNAAARWRPWSSCRLRLWFVFGVTNLIYQNIGMLIVLLDPRQSDERAVGVEKIGKLAETGAIMGLTLVASGKMWFLVRHGRAIAVLMQRFRQIFPSRTGRPSNALVQYRVDYFAKRSGALMGRMTTFFIAAFLYYNALPIVEWLYESLSAELTVQYRYQSNTWYPWQSERNAESLVAFIGAYICQMQSSLTGVAFIMGGEFMLCFFITQMQMHLDGLAGALATLDGGALNANGRLKLLIAYHNRLLGLSKEINRIFNISFFVNFVTSSIAICLMGFSMVMISVMHAFKYAVGLLFFLVLTLFVCYNGNEFNNANDKLMPAAFHSNWYDGDPSYRKMIYFFVMKTMPSRQLQVYKFTTVSMTTYMAILKLSYQLFTFFQAMV